MQALAHQIANRVTDLARLASVINARSKIAHRRSWHALAQTAPPASARINLKTGHAVAWGFYFSVSQSAARIFWASISC
jgi:hypothetical protein